MKLKALPRIVTRWAGLVAVLGTLLGLAGTYYSVLLYKNLRTDIEELLPHEARSGRDLKALTKRLESFDYLAVLVLTKDAAAGKRYLDDLTAKLNTIPKNLAARVEYRITDELGFFKKRLGLFVELPDLVKLRDYIRDRVKFDKEMYSPFNIFPVTERMKRPELDIDALEKKYKKEGAYDTFPDGYYATADGTKRAALVYLAGKHSDIHKAKELSQVVYRMVGELDPKQYAPDLTVTYAGGVQSFLEEHSALIADLELSTFVVTVLVTLAMLLFYRDVAATTALCLSLFLGTFWTFGISYFAVGYLNANSAFLGSIVIGNGINFGIIMLARYVEERRKGRGGIRATRTAMSATATATLTAALAAGLSYGSLILTRFRGFQQFGVIGLIGMVLCWISAYTLLPAFLILIERWWPSRRVPASPDRSLAAVSNGVAWLVAHATKPICLVMAALTVLAVMTLPRVSPDIIQTDLSKLRNKYSIEKGAGFNDKYLVEIFQHYLTQTVVLAKSREEAGRIAAKLKQRQLEGGKATEIASVQTLDDFTPKDQEKKIKAIGEIRAELTPSVLRSLSTKQRQQIEDFLTPEVMHPFTEKDLPGLIKEKFTEVDGSYGKIVVVEPPLDPNDDIAWKGDRLIRFITEIRDAADSVAPGTPVAGQLPISTDMVRSISEDGPKATLFALVAVILLVVLLFREVSTIGWTLFALALGVIWLGGCILGFGLKINFLNFIALPITFGIGVDYGVNMFQRYRQERGGGRDESRILTVIKHAGGPVLLASLTTIVGYSSLLIAGNQAFVSFGRLAVLGEITCVTAAVVFLPAFLLLRERRAGTTGIGLGVSSRERARELATETVRSAPDAAHSPLSPLS